MGIAMTMGKGISTGIGDGVSPSLVLVVAWIGFGLVNTLKLASVGAQCL